MVFKADFFHFNLKAIVNEAHFQKQKQCFVQYLWNDLAKVGLFVGVFI